MGGFFLCVVCDVYMAAATLSGLEVMQRWIDALDPERNYTLKEEFQDGHIATHWNTMDSDEFTHEELKCYVNAIWVPSHPAELIICPA